MQLDNGFLPLLAPMSEIAGRMATQVGAQMLTKIEGGMGLLMGGTAGVQAAHVVIVGAVPWVSPPPRLPWAWALA